MPTKKVSSPKREPVNPPLKKRRVKRRMPKPVNSSATITVPMVIAALKSSNGKTGLAAEMLGCSAALVRYKFKRHKEIRRAVREARIRSLDKAENQLDKAVDRGEAWAITLKLKTLGRKRGYVEGTKATQEVTVNVQAPQDTIDYDAIPLAERLEILAKLDRAREQQARKLLAPPVIDAEVVGAD